MQKKKILRKKLHIFEKSFGPLTCFSLYFKPPLGWSGITFLPRVVNFCLFPPFFVMFFCKPAW